MVLAKADKGSEIACVECFAEDARPDGAIAVLGLGASEERLGFCLRHLGVLRNLAQEWIEEISR
jgi:hypothetical protein